MPFHLIATHCQRNTKEAVVAYLKEKGLSPDTPNFTLTSFGSHPAVKGNGYVPYYMVFDHHGKLVREHMCGDFHGGDGLAMIEWVDKFLADAPALYLGPEPFTHIEDLAKKVAKKDDLGGTVKKIQKRLTGGATGEEERELLRLYGVVESYRDREIERAAAFLATKPSRVLPLLEDLTKELKGTKLAPEADAALAAMEGSEALEQALDVEKAFGKIRAGLDRMRSCKSCKRAGSKTARLDCPDCRAANKAGIERAKRKLEKLVEENEGLPITAEVKAYLASLP